VHEQPQRDPRAPRLNQSELEEVTEMKDKKDQVPSQPRKPLTLDKKVLKHLVVKTNVKTGVSGGCGWSDVTAPTRCCFTTNHNATRVRRSG
jgi:hypothetical protein